PPPSSPPRASCSACLRLRRDGNGHRTNRSSSSSLAATSGSAPAASPPCCACLGHPHAPLPPRSPHESTPPCSVCFPPARSRAGHGPLCPASTNCAISDPRKPQRSASPLPRQPL